jgi:formamidopyrimidine-DNA glycosylase
MPELPEVESLRRSLEPHLLGRTVASAALRRRDICESYRAGRRTRTTPADLLEGVTIERLLRHGKQLAIIADSGAVLCVHLGMSGQLLFSPSPPRGGPERGRPTSHIHALWTLQPTGHLYFRDPRRFGGLWTFDSLKALQDHRWSSLGPDALTITQKQLQSALEGSRRAIKAALLDQEALAGVGNIYADEALFLARIRPGRRVANLKASEVAALAEAIRTVLTRSIASGGSTLRDYRDANGQPGSTQQTLAVYGRAGQNCTRCLTMLKHAQIAQRTTVWCPACQH